MQNFGFSPKIFKNSPKTRKTQGQKSYLWLFAQFLPFFPGLREICKKYAKILKYAPRGQIGHSICKLHIWPMRQILDMYVLIMHISSFDLQSKYPVIILAGGMGFDNSPLNTVEVLFLAPGNPRWDNRMANMKKPRAWYPGNMCRVKHFNESIIIQMDISSSRSALGVLDTRPFVAGGSVYDLCRFMMITFSKCNSSYRALSLFLRTLSRSLFLRRSDGDWPRKCSFSGPGETRGKLSRVKELNVHKWLIPVFQIRPCSCRVVFKLLIGALV